MVHRRQCQKFSLQDGTRLGSTPRKRLYCEISTYQNRRELLKRPVVKLAQLFEKVFHNLNGAGIVGASNEIQELA